jgi:uncharacterized protein YebE (UPF0316 family)
VVIPFPSPLITPPVTMRYFMIITNAPTCLNIFLFLYKRHQAKILEHLVGPETCVFELAAGFIGIFRPKMIDGDSLDPTTEAIAWTLAIFFARLTDVSMGTMRQILIIRGRRGIASVSAFFEIMIWVLAISRVITQLDKIYYMFAFALGFASGNYLGSYIEERIALGYMFAYIVPKKRTNGLAKKLREAGFGVTVINGTGLKGPEHVYNILFRRKDTQRLLRTIKKYDKNAFYTLIDVRAESGGFVKGMAKRK